MNDLPIFQSPICPLPLAHHAQVTIGHGSGGQLTHQLISDVFQKHFNHPALTQGNDGALIDLASQTAQQKLVVSTDAHIVTPLFFAGGDIGRLAVCGTVNDVAMMGADPKYLTVSFVIEEGFPIDQLEQIALSMSSACAEAGISIVAADTKVTEKGKADGLFISTTGFGLLPAGRLIAGDQARPGDAVIVTGSLGNHTIAIAEARGNLGFQSGVESDTAPLNHLTSALLAEIDDVHVLRDPTRGGLATTLVEITRQSGVTIELDEASIPIDQPVWAACSMLGLDPLYLANEGKAIVILPEAKASKAIEVLKTNPYGRNAAVIGRVVNVEKARLLLKTPFGTTRVLDMLAGEMLPRIC